MKKNSQLNLFIILSCSLFLYACGSDDDISEQQNTANSKSSTVPSKPTKAINVDKTPWKGEAQGHVSKGDPATDKVAYLVHVGRIQSALSSYRTAGQTVSRNSTPEEKELWKSVAVASVGPDIQSDYISIEPVLIKYKIPNFKQELMDLAKPETISSLLETDYKKREAQNAVQKTVSMLVSRLQTSIYNVNPSTQEVMLATSALIRTSGEAMQKGLSAKGDIMNRQEFQKGLSLIESVNYIRPKNKIHYCDKSRNINREYRDNVGELVDKLILYSGKGSETNAGDVYALAKEIETTASSLPLKDEEICKQT